MSKLMRWRPIVKIVANSLSDSLVISSTKRVEPHSHSFFIDHKKCIWQYFWTVSLIWRDLWMPNQKVILFESKSYDPMYTRCKVCVTLWMQINNVLHLRIEYRKNDWRTHVLILRTTTFFHIYVKLSMIQWHILQLRKSFCIFEGLNIRRYKLLSPTRQILCIFTLYWLSPSTFLERNGSFWTFPCCKY